MSKRCFLYWIKGLHHVDIFSEGYVGISHNPHKRLTQHVGFARVEQKHHRQNVEFKKALNNGLFEHQIILESDSTYCLEIERKLRPNKNTGWNLAIGGDGGYSYKHGLTGTSIKRDFYNMLSRARERDLIVCDEWVGEGHLENFAEFIKREKPAGTQLTIPKDGILSPDTVVFRTRKELLNDVHRKYMINGITYSINELGEMYNLKPNTITTRLKRGWSILDSISVKRSK